MFKAGSLNDQLWRASRLEAIPSRLEAIASRLEAITIGLEAIAIRHACHGVTDEQSSRSRLSLQG